MSESRVLVIDTDAPRAQTLGAILQFIDYNPMIVSACTELKLSDRRPQDWLAVILGGVENWDDLARFAEWLKADRYHPPLLVFANQHERAIERLGFDRGACMPIEYPAKYAELGALLRRASVQRADHRTPVQRGASGPSGNSQAVRRVRRMIEQVAMFDTTVLVTGESGTGKEVAAHAIHDTSSRRDKPFVPVNCGAIPSELLESELFGHEKGAFTGAISTRKGRFEMADGGTLFLDEIGDMSLPMQVKILRVLQERTYERVGSNRSVRCDVRIIAATHRNLEENIIKGTFREDLFYRLNVFPIEMPALRERLEDLPMLIEDIAGNMERMGHGAARPTPDAVSALCAYHWPGNVRELHNLIERMAVLHPHARVQAADLPPRYRATVGVANSAPALQPAPAWMPDPLTAAENAFVEAARPLNGSPAELSALPPEGVDLKDHIANIEISLIKQALLQANGVVAHAAKLLNTRRTTLVEKLRKYGLQREGLIDTEEVCF